MKTPQEIIENARRAEEADAVKEQQKFRDAVLKAVMVGLQADPEDIEWTAEGAVFHGVSILYRVDFPGLPDFVAWPDGGDQTHDLLLLRAYIAAHGLPGHPLEATT
jgi:hypothetical protein